MLISVVKNSPNFEGHKLRELIKISGSTAAKSKKYDLLADTISYKISGAVQGRLAKHPGAPKALGKFAKWFFE